MYAASSLTDLAERTDYEAWLLEAVYQIAEHKLTVVEDGLVYPPDGGAPTYTIGGSISINMGDWRPGFLKAGAPLEFVTAFKLLDMLLEWVLAENGRASTHRVMIVTDHLELTGAAFVVESAHVESVRAALDAELTVARSRWPGIADADLVGSIAWVVFDAIDADRDKEDEPREAAVAPPSYSLDDEHDDLEIGGTDTYEADSSPDPDIWLATDESVKLAAIETHHRAHAVDLPN